MNGDRANIGPLNAYTPGENPEGAALAAKPFNLWPQHTKQAPETGDPMAEFERRNPLAELTEWPLSMDFGSNVEAALFWAPKGFPVRPATGAGNKYFTDPAAIVQAWAGTRVLDGVWAVSGPGRVAVATSADRSGFPDTGPLDLFEQGPDLHWSESADHYWLPDWNSNGHHSTFRIHAPGGFVRVWSTRPGWIAPAHPGDHHIPSSVVLTDRTGSGTAFELPSRTALILALGDIEPLPAHMARLLDPSPLPCREQDRKGYPCQHCTAYNNNRSAADLDARRVDYLETA